jgi:hypothetical protein
MSYRLYSGLYIMRKKIVYGMHEYIAMSFMICKDHSGDQIKNEMGGACGTYGGQKRSIQDFGGET